METGIVTLGGNEIGTFQLREDDTIALDLNGGRWRVKDVLEHATENGMLLGFMFKPAFDED